MLPWQPESTDLLNGVHQQEEQLVVWVEEEDTGQVPWTKDISLQGYQYTRDITV